MTKTNKTGTIDVEPTWKAIHSLVMSGHSTAEVLLPACEVADIVRQAQKKGAKSVTFSFDAKNGPAKVEVKE